jgi:hypothetical protein
MDILQTNGSMRTLGKEARGIIGFGTSLFLLFFILFVVWAAHSRGTINRKLDGFHDPPNWHLTWYALACVLTGVTGAFLGLGTAFLYVAPKIK